MKKYFIAALALVAAVACSKDDVSDPILDSSKKSVSITIANMEQSTRAEAGETTAGVNNQACTTIDGNFYFMFADNSGKIIQVYKASELTAETGGNYLFHAIPQEITHVAAIGNCTTAPTAGENISTYETLWQTETDATIAAEYTSLLAYGDDNLTNTGGFCEVTTGEEKYNYHLYEAEITVAPYMSRIEIEHIGCTDFGNFDKIGVQNLTLAGTYVKTFTEFTQNSDLNDNAKLPYVLTTAHVHSSADANVVAPADGKVWSWNIKPQTTSNLVGSFYVYDENSSLAVPYRTVTINKYSESGTEIHKFDSGVIYRFAIDFSHENFDGSDDDYICADVTVNIAKWTVKNINIGFDSN